MAKTFQGRPVVSGKLSGKATVSKQPFNTTSSYMDNVWGGNTESAPCTDQDNKDLYKKDLSGIILCTPQCIGSGMGGGCEDGSPTHRQRSWDRPGRGAPTRFCGHRFRKPGPVLAMHVPATVEWSPHVYGMLVLVKGGLTARYPPMSTIASSSARQTSCSRRSLPLPIPMRRKS